MRDEILALLSGKKVRSMPAFSGLIHVTTEGLAGEGLRLHEVHHDAGKMARAAASTFKLTGIPSATLPLDLCTPAEALGAELTFHEDGEMQFPQVKKLLFTSVHEVAALSPELKPHSMGRIPLICKAVELAKQDIGDKAVISGMIPGPYTLMIYICKVQNLVLEMKKEPQVVLDALFHLSSLLADIGKSYLEAGADFVTVHEMGGSPGFIGPVRFEKFVLPPLQALTRQLPHPTVLSVCGRTDAVMEMLAQCGADAISVDQTNNLAASRSVLKDVMLFGNIDPVGILYQGNEGSVAESVQKAKEAGVDAVWPGCDLVLQTPVANIRALGM